MFGGVYAWWRSRPSSPLLRNSETGGEGARRSSPSSEEREEEREGSTFGRCSHNKICWNITGVSAERIVTYEIFAVHTFALASGLPLCASHHDAAPRHNYFLPPPRSAPPRSARSDCAGVRFAAPRASQESEKEESEKERQDPFLQPAQRAPRSGPRRGPGGNTTSPCLSAAYGRGSYVRVVRRPSLFISKCVEKKCWHARLAAYATAHARRLRGRAG